MYYSQDEIDRIKSENPPIDIAIRHRLEPKRQGLNWVTHCPFHAENSPSFTIEADHCHCYGCGKHIRDSIAFEAELSGIDFPTACKRLGGNETPQDAATRRQRTEDRRQRQQLTEAERHREKKAQRASWPKFYLGQTHDLQEVATLRGIGYAGPWLAQELGHLRFARWRNQLAWIIGDRSAVAARRLDGQLWEHGVPHKSDTLPGSEKHPIGLTNSSLPVILIEGEADYLATLARLWQQGCHEDWQAVCMLGASARLGQHAKLLKGREVIIYAHGEDAGQSAADRWKEEASNAGAKSVTIYGLTDGQDINDLTREEAA